MERCLSEYDELFRTIQRLSEELNSQITANGVLQASAAPPPVALHPARRVGFLMSRYSYVRAVFSAGGVPMVTRKAVDAPPNWVVTRAGAGRENGNVFSDSKP